MEVRGGRIRLEQIWGGGGCAVKRVTSRLGAQKRRRKGRHQWAAAEPSAGEGDVMVVQRGRGETESWDDFGLGWGLLAQGMLSIAVLVQG